MTKKILIGSHISAAGGFNKAIERAESIGCSAMQIFTKSNRSWLAKPITSDEIEAFKTAWETSNIQEIIVHAGYLINIGSGNPENEKKSTDALIDEVIRCEQLGIKYLVLHPGSHTKITEEVCINKIISNLDYVIQKTESNVTILLETMAGQGSSIGRSFEQLHKIRALSSNKRKIGFCLDTCHIFAAGYNIATEDGYRKTMEAFDSILGLENLKAIHVNDSKTKYNSHVDRHAPLGEGEIPLNIFKLLMNDSNLVDVPKILETPSDEAMLLWKNEIALLKKIALESTVC
jgi:deoxyribonuclease IV